MALSDRLSTAPGKEPWNPGYTLDPVTGVPVEIRTPSVPEALGDDYTEILEQMNIRLPEGYELRLVEVNYNQQAWTRDTVDQENAITRPNVRYRFKVVQVAGVAYTQADIDAAKAAVKKLPKRTFSTGLGEPVAAVLNLSDMQLYKHEGGGIDATLQRVHDGRENFHNWVKRQRKGGRNIDEVVIVNNGDPYEGIAGNYDSQLHTVQGGLRVQMNTVLDVWTEYAKDLYPRFDKGQFVSVLCNHGELGRLGGRKNQTGDEDNGSALLAETLQRVLDGRPEFEHVKFTIPWDEMSVFTDVAGVPMGFTHGHKIPGADATGFEKWLNGQVRGDEQAHKARVWVTAHRHNFQSWDLGSATGFQTPSCDGGSKWLRDGTGRFSRSGIFALLVGTHDPMGWSDPVFL